MFTSTSARRDRAIDATIAPGGGSPTGGGSFKAWLAGRIAAASRLPADRLLTETITITPADAELILAEHNAGNRAIMPRKVTQWAHALRDGRWMLTSQGVSFARDGRLNNGQHRLSAVVASGVPAPFLVVFGEDRKVFNVLDTGGIRKGSDALHIAGYLNTGVLAATARLYLMLGSNAPHANATISNDLICAAVEANPDLQDSIGDGVRVGRKLKTSASAVAVALCLIRRHSSYAHRVDAFVDRLADGVGATTKSDPVHVLREGLINKQITAMAGGNTGPIAAAIVMAWSRWVRGKTVQKKALDWPSDAPFPDVE